MLCRIPVRIDATTIAVTIPTTIPNIVRTDRNLCETMLSNAIFRTSIGNDAETLIWNYVCCNATIGSNRAAFHAGYNPATIPMMLETATDRMMYPGVIVIVI